MTNLNDGDIITLLKALQDAAYELRRIALVLEAQENRFNSPPKHYYVEGNDKCKVCGTYELEWHWNLT